MMHVEQEWLGPALSKGSPHCGHIGSEANKSVSAHLEQKTLLIGEDADSRIMTEHAAHLSGQSKLASAVLKLDTFISKVPIGRMEKKVSLFLS
ncbi:MAG: hypothetical protein GY847_41305 [Proteobacteria bacterium]|nr:hypothetical protein [Pseudomonadota bacterium]